MTKIIMKNGRKEFIQISNHLDFKFQVNSETKNKIIRSKVFMNYKNALDYYNNLNP